MPSRADLAVLRQPAAVLALIPFIWFPGPWSAAILAGILVWWGARWVRSGRSVAATGYEIPFAVLLLAAALAAVAVADWSLAAPKYYGLFFGILVTCAVASAPRTPDQVLLAADATVIVLGGGLALAAPFVTEWTANKLLPLDSLLQQAPLLPGLGTVVRARAGVHPNELGGVLALLLPLAWARVLAPGTDFRPRRIVLAIAFVLMAGVLILTQSRSAYAGAAVGLLVVTGVSVARLPTGRRRVALPLFCLLVVAAAGVGVLGFRAWITAAAGRGLDTFAGRQELWERGLTMLQDFPFTGIGPGQFARVLPELYLSFRLPADVYVPHAHNLLLQIALDFGPLGLLGFGLLLLAFARSVWVVLRRGAAPPLTLLSAGLGAGLVGLLAYGLTDAIALGARGALPLWIVLGLTAALTRVVQPRPQAEPPAASPPAARGQSPLSATTSGQSRQAR